MLIFFDGLKYTLGGDAVDSDGEEEIHTNTAAESDYFFTNIKHTHGTYGPSWMADQQAQQKHGYKKKHWQKKYSSIPDSVHEFPCHHPYSPFYADFMLPKLLFLLLNFIVILVTWYVQHNSPPKAVCSEPFATMLISHYPVLGF